MSAILLSGAAQWHSAADPQRPPDAQQPERGDDGIPAVALDEAKRDDETRVIVIAAAGPAFCSGHNLKEITEQRRDEDQGKAISPS